MNVNTLQVLPPIARIVMTGNHNDFNPAVGQCPGEVPRANGASLLRRPKVLMQDNDFHGCKERGVYPMSQTAWETPWHRRFPADRHAGTEPGVPVLRFRLKRGAGMIHDFGNYGRRRLQAGFIKVLQRYTISIM